VEGAATSYCHALLYLLYVCRGFMVCTCLPFFSFFPSALRRVAGLAAYAGSSPPGIHALALCYFLFFPLGMSWRLPVVKRGVNVVQVGNKHRIAQPDLRVCAWRRCAARQTLNDAVNDAFWAGEHDDLFSYLLP
jgi:hypothetical protein